MRSFVKMKSSRNGEITPLIIDIGKAYTMYLVAKFSDRKNVL